MTDVDYYEHEILQGNTSPLIFQFTTPENGFDATGSDWVLTLTWPDGSRTLKVTDGSLLMEIVQVPDNPADPFSPTKPATIVTWPCTVIESRLFPLGRLVRFELERQVPGGEQRTYVQGIFDVRKINNVD